jgi:hypothetical protein
MPVNARSEFTGEILVQAGVHGHAPRRGEPGPGKKTPHVKTTCGAPRM